MEETTQVAEASVEDVSVLTEAGYNTLCDLINSSDSENHVLTQVMLTKLNISKSIYWIWRLVNKSKRAHVMVNLRTKLGRKFRDDTDLHRLQNMDAYTFAEWINGKGWLTKEIYELVKDDIILRFTNSSANIFFNMQFIIKDEFTHLDSQDHAYDV